MNCIIIDDEPLAITIIKSYCDNYEGITILETFTNAMQALTFMNTHNVDLVFTDIEMPQINGVDLIKSIDHKPLFIFTTAYPEYALEGFELNAIDYLVKPIPFPRFVKAVSRAKKVLNSETTQYQSNNTPATVIEDKTETPYLFIKSEYGNSKINIDQICYIQGLKDYLKIHLDNGKTIITLMSFKNIQTKLPEKQFFRIHRSFLVNMSFVQTIQKNKVLIKDQRLPIGPSFKEAFHKHTGI